jgi:hypothetical protein
MSWKAEEIGAALETAIEDYGVEDVDLQIRIEEPDEEAPGRSFVVHTRHAGRWTRAEISVGLVNAYLADEEAAVDEFKRWVERWVRSWTDPRGGGG